MAYCRATITRIQATELNINRTIWLSFETFCLVEHREQVFTIRLSPFVHHNNGPMVRSTNRTITIATTHTNTKRVDFVENAFDTTTMSNAWAAEVEIEALIIIVINEWTNSMDVRVSTETKEQTLKPADILCAFKWHHDDLWFIITFSFVFSYAFGFVCRQQSASHLA